MNTITNELGNVRRALNNLTDETIQQTSQRGYYIKNYKGGYDLLKPILGNRLRYDISKRSRESLKWDLGIYESQLTNQLDTTIRTSTTINETKVIRDLFPNYKGPITKQLFPTVAGIKQELDLTTQFKKSHFITFVNNERFENCIPNTTHFSVRAVSEPIPALQNLSNSPTIWKCKNGRGSKRLSNPLPFTRE